MTPEERVTKIFDVPESEMCSDVIPLGLEGRIAQAIQEAKAEAYEEAAKIAESYDSGYKNGEMYDMVAADIRALKTSLAVDPVS